MTRFLVLAMCGFALALATRPIVAQGKFLDKDAAGWVAQLGSADAKVRRGAAFALGKMGTHAGSATPRLKEALKKDPDAKVREAAAFALGEIAKESLKLRQDADLIAVLAGKVKADSDKYVRRSAAYALGCLGPDAQSAREVLDAALEDSDPAVRQNAVWALGRLGNETLPALRKGLKDADALVKRDAAASLALLGGDAKPAVPELLECLKTDNSEVRRAALAVIIKVVGPGDKEAADSLREALRDPDVEVRRGVALALGNIGGSDAVAALPILLEALAKGDLAVKRQSAAVIRNIGPDAFTAVHPLRKALSSPDAELRANAAMALAGIGKAAESAVPELVKLVANRNETADVRVEAATALARIGEVDAAREAVPKLLAVLEDPRNDTRVRERIIWALRVHNIGLADLKAFPAFIKVMGEEKKKDTNMLRYDCAYMLGMLQGSAASKEVLVVLREFLHDDLIVLWKKRDVIADIGPEGQSAKIKGGDMGEGDGRVMAIEALERVGPARVSQDQAIVRQLRAIVADSKLDPDLRKKTSKLLEKLK